MFKKIVLAMAVTALSVASFSTVASARTRYTVTENFGILPLVYHNRDTASHAMWNWNHTVKLHNLRNYPHTSWTATREARIRHGKTVARYNYVVSRNHRTAGWVWHGFLAAGTATKRPTVANTPDGIKLSAPASFYENSRHDYADVQLDRYIIQHMQADGFTYNDPLAGIMDYYWSNNQTPKTLPLAQAVQIEHPKKLAPVSQISTAEIDKVPDVAHWIDPKNGNVKLETTGQGQLGNHIVAWAENQLTTHHATQYALWAPLHGSIYQDTPKLQLVLYMAP